MTRVKFQRIIILFLLVLSVAFLANCSNNSRAPEESSLAHLVAGDFPLNLHDISVSDELATHIQAGIDAFQNAANNESEFTDLAIRDQLVLAIERPETRQAAGDELYRRWQNDPTEFLWVTTATRYEFLLNRKSERDKILADPALSDTLTAAGAFAHGLTHYSYDSRGRFYNRAFELDGISLMNRLLLLRKTAMVKSRQGEHLAAVRQLLAALPEARQRGGVSMEVNFWATIVRYLRRADRLDDAVHALAMGIYLADNSNNIMRQARFRTDLAGLLHNRQEDAIALGQYEVAVEFARTQNVPWVIMDALDRAAGLSSSLGRPQQALVFDRQSLTQSMVMGDSLNAPRNMMNISDDFLQMGVLDSCEVYHKRARLWVDSYPNKQNLARLPFQQLEYYCHLGQYDTVDSLLTLASNYSTTAGLALDEVNLMVGIINRGLEMSQPDLAFRSLSRLQQLRPIIFNQQPEQNVMADVELATAGLYMALGEYGPAREALEAARSVVQQSGVVEKKWLYHRSAGKLAALRGDFSTAGKEFALGLQLAQESTNPSRIAESRHLLGHILLLDGQTKQARALFVAQDLDPAFGGSFRTRLTNLWFQGRSWRQDGDLATARKVLENAVENSTPFSPADLMAGIYLDLGRTLMDQNLPDLAKINFDLAGKFLSAENSGTLVSYLDDTRRHLSEAMIAWHLQNQNNSNQQTKILNALFEANQAVLRSSMGSAANAASVEQLLAMAPAESCTGLFFLGQEQSYLWIGHHGQWQVVELPAANEIKILVRTVLADLQQPTRQPDSQALYRLGNLLLGPIMPSWKTGQELSLVADGFLHNIPWSALKVSEANAGRVLEYGPLAESPGLMINHSSSVAPQTKQRTLLAMGYNGNTDQKNRLGNAEKEARLIAENWQAGPAHLLTGTEAAWSTAVLEKLPEVSVLHLASHASVREGFAADSFLLLALDDGNEPLTAQAISELSWPGELVFLSSCEAGRSHRSGQGMMGLAGSFLEAGVQAVLASSAEVDDEAGLYFAQQFYRNWVGEERVDELDNRSAPKSRAAAMQAAQRSMLQKEGKWSHPFYWAHYRLIQR